MGAVAGRDPPAPAGATARVGAGIPADGQEPRGPVRDPDGRQRWLHRTQVPLTLYNNWVRWVWVYVQYLGKDNENLSPNPNPTWPDTKYAQSLGLLPQVFTVLGVPLWDTNTITKTLNFPEEAHTARLLFCGLGSNLLDGSWREYFPADAYLDPTATR